MRRKEKKGSDVKGKQQVTGDGGGGSGGGGGGALQAGGERGKLGG